MRCHACGKWNKSNLPHCFYCGAPLSHAPAGLPEFEEQAYEEEEAFSQSLSRDELRERRERGEEYKDRLRRRHGTRATHKIDSPRYPGEPYREEEPKKSRMKALGRTLRRIGRLPAVRLGLRLLWVILLAGTAFAGYHIYGGALENMEEQKRIDMNRQSVSVATTVVETEENPAADAHVITFYGEPGDVVYIEESQASYILTEDKLDITLPDEERIPKTPAEGQERVQVTLTPQIFRTTGEKLQLDPIKYTVEIPHSELRFIKPEGGMEEITSEMYTLRLEVGLHATVLFNGADISDLRDQNGQIVYTVETEAVGDNIYALEVKQPHRQPRKSNIVLTRQRQEIDLYFTSTMPDSSESSTRDVKGRAAPGAEVIVESEHSGELKHDPETGIFSFVAKFTKLGDNTITVRAKKGDLKDSIITHTLLYVPNLDEYSRTAWRLVYTDLAGNVPNNKGRVYAFTGRITRLTDSEPTRYYMDIAAEGEKAQLLVLEQASTTDMRVGGLYKVYADVRSEFDGLPLLTARYVYPQEEGEEP